MQFVHKVHTKIYKNRKQIKKSKNYKRPRIPTTANIVKFEIAHDSIHSRECTKYLLSCYMEC